MLTIISSAVINHKLFKNTVHAETYLTDLDFAERISLCKFRCRNRKLPVSEYRFSGSDDISVCTVCDSGDIGDAYHYLFATLF
jgi:hypothetical protein